MKKIISICMVLVLVLSLMILPASAASNLVITSDYSAAQLLNGDNGAVWGALPKIKQHLSFQFAKAADGLKVKITVPSSELELDAMIQINFNPDNKIPAAQTGLFLSVIPQAGNKVRFLQHNHKTNLMDNDAAGGIDITPTYTSKVVGSNQEIEFTLPTSFFQIKGISEDFTFKSTQKLGYILFCVELAGGTRTGSSFAGIAESDWKVGTLTFTEMTFEAPANPTTGDISLIGYAVVALSSMFLKKKRF